MSIKNKVLIVILVFEALVAAGFYFSYQKYFLQKTEQTIAPVVEKPIAAVGEPRPTGREIAKPSAPATSAPKTETTFPGFKLYKNSDFGFEIQYPESWIVSAENIVNVRGENTKGFFFKKLGSDLRFAVLPKDGLSYGLPSGGASENVNISGFLGVQTKYITADGRRLLLVHPQVNIFNWDSEIGRLDIMSGVLDPAGDFKIFNQMLNSFKFINL